MIALYIRNRYNKVVPDTKLELKKELKDFVKHFPVRVIKKGQTVLFQGEVPRQVYIIKSGAIKAYNIDPNGEEKIIALVGTNEIMAPSWVFNKAPVALYYYDAFVDTEVYILSREDLQNILDTNKDALRAAFDRIVSVFIGSNIHINALENSKSSQKIVNLLHYLTMRFGTTPKENKVTIDLRLTQHDLARMLGLTRETVAMELSRLKKQNILSYKSQHYSVDTKALQRLHGEEGFAELEIE